MTKKTCKKIINEITTQNLRKATTLKPAKPFEYTIRCQITFLYVKKQKKEEESQRARKEKVVRIRPYRLTFS